MISLFTGSYSIFPFSDSTRRYPFPKLSFQHVAIIIGKILYKTAISVIHWALSLTSQVELYIAMLFIDAFIKLVLILVPVFAAPSALKTVAKYNGQVKNGSYIVTLKQGVSRTICLQSLGLSPNSNITHEWDTVFNGFAGMILYDLC
jgi:hypothetical protein